MCRGMAFTCLLIGLVASVIGGCGGGKKTLTGPQGQQILVWEEKWDEGVGKGKIHFTYQFYYGEVIDDYGFERADERHVFAGYYRAYREDGTPSVEANFKGGLRDGKMVVYYENGKIRAEMNYVAGRQSGKWSEYYENGTIKAIGEEITPRDSWSAFYDESGKVTAEQHYKDGKLNGKWVLVGTDERGAYLDVEGNYKDGEKDGKWVYYDENGNVTKEATYANGSCISGC